MQTKVGDLLRMRGGIADSAEQNSCGSVMMPPSLTPSSSVTAAAGLAGSARSRTSQPQLN
jgi:hypothetical protein